LADPPTRKHDLNIMNFRNPIKGLGGPSLPSAFEFQKPLSEKEKRDEQLRVRRQLDDASRYGRSSRPELEMYGQMIGATGGGSPVYDPRQAKSIMTGQARLAPMAPMEYSGGGGGGGGGYAPREPIDPKLPRMPIRREGLRSGTDLENPFGGSIASGVTPTLGETPLQFSEGDYSFTSPNMGMGGMGSYTPPPTMQTPSFGLEGSSLTSPLTGPSPIIPFPTREDEILNPYGLRNYRNY
jgi:hypothetical protein